MTITPDEFANGLFSLIYVFIAALIGLIIASKYFKYKQRILLLMGFTWIFIGCPWWPSSTSFLLAIITGKGLSFEIYVIIGNCTVPIFLMLLTASMTELIFKKERIILLLIAAIYGILIEIYIFYSLNTNPDSLGTLNGIVDIEYKGILRYYLVSIIIIILISGILIGRQSIRSEKPEIKLKGKFLLIAFILWVVGAFADAVLPLTVITLPIIRIILILSSGLFYFGFILPKFLRRIILHEK